VSLVSFELFLSGLLTSILPHILIRFKSSTIQSDLSDILLVQSQPVCGHCALCHATLIGIVHFVFVNCCRFQFVTCQLCAFSLCIVMVWYVHHYVYLVMNCIWRKKAYDWMLVIEWLTSPLYSTGPGLKYQPEDLSWLITFMVFSFPLGKFHITTLSQSTMVSVHLFHHLLIIL
jgi:hypothetical protein